MISDKSTKMYELDQKGMTLLETMVALGLFSLVIVFTMGLFISGIKSQARASEMNLVNNEASFLLERMGREIRMANKIDDMQIRDYNGGGTPNPGPRINFTNHESKSAVYCQADSSGVCASGVSAVAVSVGYDGSFVPISSPNVKVTDLQFYSNGDLVASPAEQPIITILLELESSRDPSVTIKLQTSVVPRVY